MKNKSKWIWGGILLPLAVITILVLSFREAILIKTGRFMAPAGDYTADAAILEGSDYATTGMVKSGMDLLFSGKVKRLVIVLHRIDRVQSAYGLAENYPDLVRRTLRNNGLKETDFQIIETPRRFPITLTEAKVVLDVLSQEKVKSAILLSPGFHTRRSYLAYQHVANPFHMKIFPLASFSEYKPDQWWAQDGGVRDCLAEIAKLIIYWGGGYIPLRFSY